MFYCVVFDFMLESGLGRSQHHIWCHMTSTWHQTWLVGCKPKSSYMTLFYFMWWLWRRWSTSYDDHSMSWWHHIWCHLTYYTRFHMASYWRHILPVGGVFWRLHYPITLAESCSIIKECHLRDRDPNNPKAKQLIYQKMFKLEKR